ncbi:PilZ domain-containing protein [bacterium]|nr:PilZ domain-containing protein [bacterium]
MVDLFILVVSRDANFKDYICNHLLMDGHYVDTTDKPDIARRMLQAMRYDLVLLNLSEFSKEIEALSEEEIHEINPDSEVIFLFNPNIENDKDLMPNKRIENCLVEPFLFDDLPSLLEKVRQEKALRTGKDVESQRKNHILRERRKCERIKSEIPVRCTFIYPLGNIPSEENISKIIDIGQGGVMFRIDFRVKFSESVYLNILLPTCTSPINIEGHVIWDRFNSSDPWRYMGVKFFNLNPEHRKQIDSFISLKR